MQCKARFAPFGLLALAALALAPRPASAQGPGHWVLSVKNEGSTHYEVSGIFGTFVSDDPWSQMDHGAATHEQFWSDTIFSAVSAGKTTLVAEWLDSLGKPASNPPAKVFVSIRPWSSWGISYNIYAPPITVTAHFANDGLGDPEKVYSFDGFPDYGDSRPSENNPKPTMLDGSSGRAEKVLSLDAGLLFSSASPGSAGASCWTYANVLNFNAGLSSSIDPTYHRGMGGSGPIRVPNEPDGGRNTNADSHIPPDGPFKAFSLGKLDVTFNGNTSGDWSPHSTYHWYSEAKNYGTGNPGEFDPLDPLTNTYTNSDSKGERVDLHLTDKLTGYETHVDYRIKFHQRYEDWVKTKSVKHPSRFIPGGLNPDWVYLFRAYNPSGAAMGQDTGQEVSLKETITGEFSAKQSGGVEGISAFEYNEKVTVGTEVSAKVTATQKFTIPPYTDANYYVAMSSEDRYGTTSVWGENGYLTDDTWHVKWVSPVLSMGIDPLNLAQPVIQPGTTIPLGPNGGATQSDKAHEPQK